MRYLHSPRLWAGSVYLLAALTPGLAAGQDTAADEDPIPTVPSPADPTPADPTPADPTPTDPTPDVPTPTAPTPTAPSPIVGPPPPPDSEVAVPVVPPLGIQLQENDGDEVGTAASSIIEATGQLRSDTGRAALYGSMASINLQRAVEEYLENQVARVRAYNEIRAIWDAARAARRRQPLTEEGYRKIAQQRSPDRLESDRLNPQSGEILWPPPLDADVLNEPREAIEKLFAKRGSPGHRWTAADYRQVDQQVQVMIRSLRAVEDLLPVQEFVALLQLLERISWEAQHDGNGNRLDLLGGGVTRPAPSSESRPVVPEPPQPARQETGQPPAPRETGQPPAPREAPQPTAPQEAGS